MAAPMTMHCGPNREPINAPVVAPFIALSEMLLLIQLFLLVFAVHTYSRHIFTKSNSPVREVCLR